MNKNSKKRAMTLLFIGLVALAIAAWLYFSNDSAAVNAANLEIAQNATNARDAAQQIAANNQSDYSSHILSMFLLGIGGVFTLFSILMLLQKKGK